CQQAIAIAIAAKARHAGARFEHTEALSLRWRRKKVGVGGAEDGVGESRTGPYSDASRLAVSASPARALRVRPKPLTSEGLVHQTQGGLTFIQQSDQRSPER